MVVTFQFRMVIRSISFFFSAYSPTLPFKKTFQEKEHQPIQISAQAPLVVDLKPLCRGLHVVFLVPGRGLELRQTILGRFQDILSGQLLGPEMIQLVIWKKNHTNFLVDVVNNFSNQTFSAFQWCCLYPVIMSQPFFWIFVSCTDHCFCSSW